MNQNLSCYNSGLLQDLLALSLKTAPSAADKAMTERLTAMLVAKHGAPVVAAALADAIEKARKHGA